MTSPVLLTAFNRPRETRLVIDAIRRYAPSHMYIAVDGPRSNRPHDASRCAEVVRILERVDWDCQVERLIRAENLGCRRSMAGAVDWFFESVPEGIILEDDCVPSADFFCFADELLERYRDDDRVAMVSGTNVLREWRPTDASYFFGQGAVWGWASWRRAWGHSSQHLAGLASRTACATARRTLGSARWRQLKPKLRAVASGELDTWDYPWVFEFAARGQVAAIPAVNLVSNIGFGPEATHTTSTDGSLARLETLRLEDPLRHPEGVVVDREFDARWQALEVAAAGRGARLGRRLPPPVRSVLRWLRGSKRQ